MVFLCESNLFISIAVELNLMSFKMLPWDRPEVETSPEDVPETTDPCSVLSTTANFFPFGDLSVVDLPLFGVSLIDVSLLGVCLVDFRFFDEPLIEDSLIEDSLIDDGSMSDDGPMFDSCLSRSFSCCC